MEGLVSFPNRSFWAGRSVLVTGHTGFKGAWLCAWLERLGATVTGLSLAPKSQPNLFEAMALGQKTVSIIGDIRDSGLLIDVVRRRDVEIIIHMAAQALVLESVASPVETFSTNVMGTVNVLEAARQIGSVRAVLVVSSDKVYLNRDDDRQFVETDRLGGDDPYSSSKASAELVVHSYRSTYFTQRQRSRLSSARAGNVVGGGDWSANRIIPDIVRAIASQDKVHIRHPDARRPWQWVLDPLRGYLLQIEHLVQDEGETPEALNFGPRHTEQLAVLDVARIFLQRFGQAVEDRCVFSPSGPSIEKMRLGLDASQARERLAWAPALTQHEAISWTADWYLGLAQGRGASDLVAEQIVRYEELLRATASDSAV